MTIPSPFPIVDRSDPNYLHEWAEWARRDLSVLEPMIAELKVQRDANPTQEQLKSRLALGYPSSLTPINAKIAEYKTGQAVEELEKVRAQLLDIIAREPKTPLTRRDLARTLGRVFFESRVKYVKGRLPSNVLTGRYACYVCGAEVEDWFSVRRGMQIGFIDDGSLCETCYLDYSKFRRSLKNSRYYESEKGQTAHKK